MILSVAAMPHGTPACAADTLTTGEHEPFPIAPGFKPAIPTNETATHSIPYFLKDRAALYEKSPRTAALAWFDDTRLGMFIHWGVWGWRSRRPVAY